MSTRHRFQRHHTAPSPRTEKECPAPTLLRYHAFQQYCLVSLWHVTTFRASRIRKRQLWIYFGVRNIGDRAYKAAQCCRCIVEASLFRWRPRIFRPPSALLLAVGHSPKIRDLPPRPVIRFEIGAGHQRRIVCTSGFPIRPDGVRGGQIGDKRRADALAPMWAADRATGQSIVRAARVWTSGQRHRRDEQGAYSSGIGIPSRPCSHHWSSLNKTL